MATGASCGSSTPLLVGARGEVADGVDLGVARHRQVAVPPRSAHRGRPQTRAAPRGCWPPRRPPTPACGRRCSCRRSGAPVVASTRSTVRPRRTSTPSLRSFVSALADSEGANGPSTRSVISTSTTRARAHVDPLEVLGQHRAEQLGEPAGQLDPVGPPPTITTVRRPSSTIAGSQAARSKRRSTWWRRSRASWR